MENNTVITSGAEILKEKIEELLSNYQIRIPCHNCRYDYFGDCLQGIRQDDQYCTQFKGDYKNE